MKIKKDKRTLEIMRLFKIDQIVASVNMTLKWKIDLRKMESLALILRK